MSLLDLIEGDARSLAEASGRIYGVVAAIVTDNADPEKQARVKLRFPWLAEDEESDWAPIATLMAGGGRGTVFLPEVDDEVLVAFLHGDPRRPFVVGALWNGRDAPPETNEDGANDVRVIHTRSGHLIRFTDTDGGEKLEIVDAKGTSSLVFDTASSSVTLTSAGDLTLSASGGKVTIEAAELEVKASGSAKVEASASMELKASGTMDVKGATVNLN